MEEGRATFFHQRIINAGIILHLKIENVSGEYLDETERRFLRRAKLIMIFPSFATTSQKI